MSSWLQTWLSGVTGGVIGSAASLVTTRLNLSHQRNSAITAERNQRENTLAAEHRAREKAATERAMNVFAELLQADPPTYVWVNAEVRKARAEGDYEPDDDDELPPRPDGHDELIEAWMAKRDGLLVTLQMAAVDIGDAVLRGCLTILHYTLTRAGDMIVTDTDIDFRPVHRRREACRFGIDCIGAYRRREALPDTPPWYTDEEMSYEGMLRFASPLRNIEPDLSAP